MDIITNGTRSHIVGTSKPNYAAEKAAQQLRDDPKKVQEAIILDLVGVRPSKK